MVSIGTAVASVVAKLALAGVSPTRLNREMGKVDQLLALLGEENADPKLILDLIEGETEALEIADAYIEAVLADNSLIDLARERVKRLEARVEKNRNTLLQILQDKLHMKSLQRPLATAYISHTTAQARVTDQEKLPKEYLRTAPDLVKLGAALRSGQRIEGAVLSNERAILMVKAG